MGKSFVIDTAPCKCKYGTTPGKLKVNSHKLVVMNHGDGKMATSLELQNAFYPPGFGSCKRYSPYIKPCVPNVIKWSNLFDHMRLPGNAHPLLSDSKGTCALGGPDCIEILSDGQIEVPGPRHVKNATAEHQQELDPAGDLSTTGKYDKATVQKAKL